MSEKKSKNSPLLALLLVGIGIGAIMVGAAFLIFYPDRQSTMAPRAPRPGGASLPPPAVGSRTLSPAVYRVALQFVCTCGACGEKPLESCDCPTAVEERGFINQQLAAGQTEAQAADALQAKYGGRKPPGTTAGRAGAGLTDDQIVGLLNQNSPGAGHLATTADRAHIIAHFKCPCNQCAIDELRDCECPHPNGAQEVKRFIDDTISQQQHTVGQIVALVEQRYGGRIR